MKLLQEYFYQKYKIKCKDIVMREKVREKGRCQSNCIEGSITVTICLPLLVQSHLKLTHKEEVASAEKRFY